MIRFPEYKCQQDKYVALCIQYGYLEEKNPENLSLLTHSISLNIFTENYF